MAECRAGRAASFVHPDWTYSVIPGLSRWALADIRRVETTEPWLSPGEVAFLYRELQRYARVAHRYWSHWSVGSRACHPWVRGDVVHVL
ncbi:hypothetical protein LX15_000106 [Streptoalloteichus tenebrarius]|uniref:Uncharacterized protein n=1 Tax=Streptoalloteichus tenebrarius (strain ATCC 17920 / DSM 40477 / JCM 4838 / CBS 697.72 / NBRC 16177 / NCIMB 11028 / NRRL B-12390 / A12253. 1 / ISP 5477) TaxID=1933 RepID=A0ABT1HLP8_STRSD|nr:hypothetical protein [Streptoalloteichus tenebrarius]BFF04774.1 hypothetical protein GCM10020241_64490 [Streptoalloteichus tenebrarius]